jgi:hypothetical protein
MAIEALSRWQMIREIIIENRSGTLIAQLGKHFLHWMVAEGKLVCISSTLPEYSLTQFLLQKAAPSRSDLLRAQGLIHHQRSLGSALLDAKILSAQELSELLKQHWRSLSFHLLQGSTHLFWSDRCTEFKHHFVRTGVPLQEILLAVDRTFIDTRAAIRFAQNMPAHYRIVNWLNVEKFFQESETRMVNYLKNCSTLPTILKDPELDKMTCYRVLFLLWVAGALQEPVARRRLPASVQDRSNPFMERLRSLPPDWIFPLIAGALIGALLSSAPGKANIPSSAPHIESLRDAITESNRQDTKKLKAVSTDEHR